MKKPLSLRSTLLTLTILVAALAVLISGALIAFTDTLNKTTTTVGMALESVRLAEEAEIDLLLLERAEDPIVRRELEGDLLHKLTDAERFIATQEEAQALAEASVRVKLYLEATHDPHKTLAERAAQQEVAYGALEELVAINMLQAKEAQQAAQRWDNVSHIVGVGVGALLLVVSGALLIWLKGRAFEPLFDLASAMERFGRGEQNARAAERGVRELREMCSRFNEMASAIAAQRQAQMAFLGGVAHDLRNPLATLSLSASLLTHKALPPERLQQTAERIGRQITRMERMLGDFLDVAKIEAGQLELQLGIYDARKLVEEAVELFNEASQEHAIEVRLPPGVVPVRCDQMRLEQVLINLISNALKYSPPKSAVGVTLASHGEELALCVTDQGMGISESDLSRIFEPFRRVGLSKEAIPGVGLGLFVVRTLVEAHRGRIEVKSAPGQGSTFCVFLPLERTLLEEKALSSELA